MEMILSHPEEGLLRLNPPPPKHTHTKNKKKKKKKGKQRFSRKGTLDPEATRLGTLPPRSAINYMGKWYGRLCQSNRIASKGVVIREPIASCRPSTVVLPSLRFWLQSSGVGK